MFLLDVSVPARRIKAAGKVHSAVEQLLQALCRHEREKELVAV